MEGEKSRKCWLGRRPDKQDPPLCGGRPGRVYQRLPETCPYRAGTSLGGVIAMSFSHIKWRNEGSPGGTIITAPTMRFPSLKLTYRRRVKFSNADFCQSIDKKKNNLFFRRF
ncbi:Uncharacterised protein at_DN1056 [Pycnogonum litorale]